MVKLWKSLFGGRARKGKIEAIAASRGEKTPAQRFGEGALKKGEHKAYTREVLHGKRGKLLQTIDIYHTEKSNKATIRILDKDGNSHGHLAVEISPVWLERNKIEGKQALITTVYVDEEYRKEGFVKQMAAEAEHLAKTELGAEKVFVVPQDKRAQKVYSKLGYTPTKRNGKVVRSGWRKFPIMEKAL